MNQLTRCPSGHTLKGKSIDATHGRTPAKTKLDRQVAKLARCRLSAKSRASRGLLLYRLQYHTFSTSYAMESSESIRFYVLLSWFLRCYLLRFFKHSLIHLFIHSLTRFLQAPIGAPWISKHMQAALISGNPQSRHYRRLLGYDSFASSFRSRRLRPSIEIFGETAS